MRVCAPKRCFAALAWSDELALKIGMLSTSGTHCGIAVYTRALIEAFESDFEIIFEPIEPGKRSLEEYEAQADRLNSCDVVHIQHEHSFWGGILPGKSAFWSFRYLLKRPVVITAHTTYSLAEMLRLQEERRPLQRLAKQWLVWRKGFRDSIQIAPFVTGRCIVHTEAGREALIERGAKPEYVHVVPAGVPKPAAPTASAEETKTRYGLPDRRWITIFGFLTPMKGYEVSLEALQELPEECGLLIAGGPRTPDMEPYARQLRERIAREGLEKRARITGYLSDEETANVMAASEIVLVPHLQATGSYSVMIGLAYGKPVVASQLDIFKEIQAKCGGLRLVRTGDAAHLAACLKGVLNNALGREEMAARSLAYARAHAWPEIAQRTTEIYRLALEDEKRLGRSA